MVTLMAALMAALMVPLMASRPLPPCADQRTYACSKIAPMGSTVNTENSAAFIPFEEFRNGLPHGRFRVVVNPALAKPFVAHCTHATPLALALFGPGVALALYGYLLTGALLVGAAWLLRWSVGKRAPFILLHLATRVPSVYEQATEHGVLEVQRA